MLTRSSTRKLANRTPGNKATVDDGKTASLPVQRNPRIRKPPNASSASEMFDNPMPDTTTTSTNLHPVLKRSGGEATERGSRGSIRPIASNSSQVTDAGGEPLNPPPSIVGDDVPKRNTGRSGYDWPAPKADQGLSPNFVAPSDILTALRIPPNHTISNGFIIPGVFTELGASIESVENTVITEINYALLGDPFKRDVNREDAGSLLLPSRLFDLVEGLHPEWKGRQNGESEMRDELWRLYSSRTAREAASARWTEQTVVEKREGMEDRVWTKGSLQFKEQNDLEYSQVGTCTCLFTGTPTDALKAWWRRPCATGGQDVVSPQSTSTSDRGGVVSYGA
jgi:hypothetical protein